MVPKYEPTQRQRRLIVHYCRFDTTSHISSNKRERYKEVWVELATSKLFVCVTAAAARALTRLHKSQHSDVRKLALMNSVVGGIGRNSGNTCTECSLYKTEEFDKTS